MLVAPAAGNHEYLKEFEDTPRERRVLGAHWPVSFALPGNGAPGAERTSYWFDAQDARGVVLDGPSALHLGTPNAPAQSLDGLPATSEAPRLGQASGTTWRSVVRASRYKNNAHINDAYC